MRRGFMSNIAKQRRDCGAEMESARVLLETASKGRSSSEATIDCHLIVDVMARCRIEVLPIVSADLRHLLQPLLYIGTTASLHRRVGTVADLSFVNSLEGEQRNRHIPVNRASRD